MSAGARPAARLRATCGRIARDLRPDSSPEPISAGAPDMISTRAHSDAPVTLGDRNHIGPADMLSCDYRLRRSRL